MEGSVPSKGLLNVSYLFFFPLLAGYNDIDRLLVATMIYCLVTGIEVIGPSKQELK